MIGLKGSYTTKKKYKRKNNADAWTTNRLYLNLSKDPKAGPTSEDFDAEIGVRYGLQFMESEPEPVPNSIFFRIGKILNYKTDEEFDDFVEDFLEGLTDEISVREQKVIRRNLQRLHNAIWRDDFISYYTERDQDYDRVLDIFVRANEGGTKLSKSDLLLSMITSRWSGINAREEIHSFVDYLNEQLDKRNSFDKDFIMKSCLVLSDLEVTYKVENFNNRNLEVIRNKWNAIKSAIERTVRLINSFNIDSVTLTSANAVIPIAYYLFQIPDVTLRGTTPEDIRNAHRIRKWLSVSLLNAVFGGQSDGLLHATRKVLKDCKGYREFPADLLNIELRRLGRNTEFDDSTIENFLENQYGRRQTFLALSLLYEENFWGTVVFHQDHIFPRDLFKTDSMERYVIDGPKHVQYLERRDSIANLQLLSPEENLEKSAKPFDNWIGSRDRSFLDRHLIPEDRSLWSFDRFIEFSIAREKLITNRLKSVFTINQPDEE